MFDLEEEDQDLQVDYYREECAVEECRYVEFHSELEMGKHVLRYHTPIEALVRNNLCGICDVQFCKRVDYNAHMSTHSFWETDWRIFDYEQYCEMEDTDTETVPRVPVKPDPDKSVICDDPRHCNSQIAKESNGSHSGIKIKTEHTGPKIKREPDGSFPPIRIVSESEKRYNCIRCKYHTDEKGNYNRHMATKTHAKKIKKYSPPDIKPPKVKIEEDRKNFQLPFTARILGKSTSATGITTPLERLQLSNAGVDKTLTVKVEREEAILKYTRANVKKEINIKPEVKPRMPIKFEDQGRNWNNSKSATIYHCEICSYATKEQGNFKRHNAVHIKREGEGEIESRRERPRKDKPAIQCLYCKFVTKETGNFSRHMGTHGIPERNKVTYYCHLCPYKTEGYKNINFHTLREHEVPALHQCEFCWTSFPTSVMLKEHRYSHADRITHI